MSKSLRVKVCGSAPDENEELKNRIKELLEQLETCQTNLLNSDETIKESINAISTAITGPSCGNLLNFFGYCFGIGVINPSGNFGFEFSETYLENPIVDSENNKIVIPNYMFNIKFIINELCECLNENLDEISGSSEGLLQVAKIILDKLDDISVDDLNKLMLTLIERVYQIELQLVDEGLKNQLKLDDLIKTVQITNTYLIDSQNILIAIIERINSIDLRIINNTVKSQENFQGVISQLKFNNNYNEQANVLLNHINDNTYQLHKVVELLENNGN